MANSEWEEALGDLRRITQEIGTDISRQRERSKQLAQQALDAYSRLEGAGYQLTADDETQRARLREIARGGSG